VVSLIQTHIVDAGFSVYVLSGVAGAIALSYALAIVRMVRVHNSVTRKYWSKY
jgi:hypothetical protein